MPNEATLHPHIAEEMAHLFTAADENTPEEEFLNVILDLIEATKAKSVFVFEPSGGIIMELIRAANPDIRIGMVYQEDPKPFDIAVLDAKSLPTNADALAALIERDLLSPRAIVAIHDTSRCRTLKDGTLDPEAAEFWERMERLVIRKHKPRAVLELPLSRGLTLIQV